MSKYLNQSLRSIGHWVHGAMIAAVTSTMGRADKRHGKRGFGRRLAVEGLEIRQLLTATLLHTLANPTPEDHENFGTSVAVSDDIVVVGAIFDNTGAERAGSAYVFDATTGALLLTLKNPTSEYLGRFGVSVAISHHIIVVGAIGDDTGDKDAGSAYAFDAMTGDLLHTLNNPTPEASDHFGYSVAISGNTIVVGAPYDDTGAENAGSAYVFDASTGELLHTLNNPTPEDDDHFAMRVAISNDTIVVGARVDDTGAPNAGSAYVFDAKTGTLAHTLNNPMPEAGDYFGDVAISGNIIVVGANGDDTGATDSGSAYVFDATTGELLHTLNNPTPQEDDLFGVGTAISGNTIVIGAFGDHTEGTYLIGSAYVFDATTGSLIETINNPTPEEFEWFGYAVAISGDTIVVGAHNDNTGGRSVGSAYVFRLDSPSTPDADFNNDGFYDVADIDRLSAAIASGSNPRDFDLTNDGSVNLDDQDAWLTAAGAINLPSGRPYPLGDANLDGWFDSSDFVHVFQAGKYEDAVDDNAVWSTGDRNGDGDFDSSDFVAAFQTGLYEVKPQATANSLGAAVDWLFFQKRRAIAQVRTRHEAQCVQRSLFTGGAYHTLSNPAALPATVSCMDLGGRGGGSNHVSALRISTIRPHAQVQSLAIAALGTPRRSSLSVCGTELGRGPGWRLP